MLGVDGAAGVGQLPRQMRRAGGIAEQQRQRLFVVDEVAGGIGFGDGASRCDGFLVVARMLDHLDAASAQAVLLPLLGIGRHVDDRLETQRRRHHADRQAQVAGRADRDLVRSEQRAGFGRGEGAVVGGIQQVVSTGQRLRMLQHFMNAAARLDRAGDRQRMVALDHQHAGIGRQAERPLQSRHGDQVGFDAAGTGFEFGKQPCQQRCEAGKPVGGGRDISRANAVECRTGAAVGCARGRPEHGPPGLQL